MLGGRIETGGGTSSWMPAVASTVRPVRRKCDSMDGWRTTPNIWRSGSRLLRVPLMVGAAMLALSMSVSAQEVAPPAASEPKPAVIAPTQPAPADQAPPTVQAAREAVPARAGLSTPPASAQTVAGSETSPAAQSAPSSDSSASPTPVASSTTSTDPASEATAPAIASTPDGTAAPAEVRRSLVRIRLCRRICRRGACSWRPTGW